MLINSYKVTAGATLLISAIRRRAISRSHRWYTTRQLACYYAPIFQPPKFIPTLCRTGLQRISVSTYSTASVRSTICSSCGNDLDYIFGNVDTTWDPKKYFFCSKCDALQPPAFCDFFALFGFRAAYDIDTSELTRRYRQTQKHLHPDKTIHYTGAEQRHAAEQSSFVNKAYDTLLKPVPRALYMLEINGQALEESDINLDSLFLMDIMELNEMVADTQDQDELERIFSENRSTLDTYVRRIADAFQSNDIEEARRLIAEIKYFVNVEDKIKERTYLH